MARFTEFIQKSFFQKFIAIVILVIVLLLLKNLLNFLLLTIVFSYLFSSLSDWCYNKIKKWVNIPIKLVILIIYGGFAATLSIAGYLYLPAIGKQIISITNQVLHFDISMYTEAIPVRIYNIIEEINISSYFKGFEHSLLKATTDIGTFLISIVTALLMSFFFVWEKEEIKEFVRKFENSKIAFLYKYYAYFGKNFLNTFGKVIQLQIMISFINSVLSVILLFALGFNQVLGLGVMIFVLGLVPVAGVVISFIPLSIIAFQLGGWVKIIHVILMILLLHAIESYVLNPKMMSAKLKMPIFFSLLVLILSEHFIGLWGLLIGIPLFMFLLDMAGVSTTSKNDKKAVLEVKEKSIG
jgi:predicted PurR-regulated permease PerM